jgi:hypothetical protein
LTLFVVKIVGDLCGKKLLSRFSIKTGLDDKLFFVENNNDSFE